MSPKYWIATSAVMVGLLAGSGQETWAAEVIAKVDLSSQTMTVIEDGKAKYKWKVSTARDGKVTPTGQWTAKRFKRFHRSSLYGRAPMPYSIFFNGNFAIHGTNQSSKLGSPASAGCIRLAKANAAKLFRMAQSVGLDNTVVIVQH